ncbi:MAG: type II toxin-antitoxin system RelE/ParE family toxin [Nitrospirae bacterium]|nr:type II toxin-antitoxin system RelE/ParE family toxin [Nitrospirota bacterium]MCL5977727.1 type II toxin-antitoxin system RelE/ParE family toxin [Nitrospirota bacterium]
MAYSVKWSPKAASHFEEICDYIAKDSRYYAALFAKKIVSIVKTLPHFPKAGRIVPEYSDANLREKIYENYRIVYRIKDEIIEIVAISHGAQQLENIL